MMTWQDYINDTREAAESFMQEERDNDYLNTWQSVQTALLEADSVTGAASGSYTHDYDEAVDNLTGVLFDDWALGELQEHYGWMLNLLMQGPEYVDVCIRQLAVNSIMPDLLRYYLALRNDGPYYACPECSSGDYGYPIDEVILERGNDGWYTCPRCGRSTSAPLEDACWEVQ